MALPLPAALFALVMQLDASPQPPPQGPDTPATPLLITARTLADPKALASLQRPGTRIFRDAFEDERSFDAYFEIGGQKEGRVQIAHDAGLAHGGKGALQLTAPDSDGKSCGAGPQLWLGNDGYDRLHMRYYIRYAEDYDQGDLNHTGGNLDGMAGDFKWAGMGRAGIRPTGDDHFSSRVEGWRDWQWVAAPGYLFCYAYWMDMKQDRDGNFWGNMMGPAANERLVPPRGQWLCVEQMLAVNTPGRDDGQLAVWLDGKLYLHYTGFRWRSSDAVRLKRASLIVYVHKAVRDNRVWFDDLVLSTGFIGPEPELPK